MPRKDFAGRLQVRSALPNTGSITEGQVAERKDDKKGPNLTSVTCQRRWHGLKESDGQIDRAH